VGSPGPLIELIRWIRNPETRQKQHVDVEAGRLRLEPGENKSREGRNFPLTPELREVLERQLEQTRARERETS
jgi:integrase